MPDDTTPERRSARHDSPQRTGAPLRAEDDGADRSAGFRFTDWALI